MTNRIYFGDNLEVLRTLPSASVELIYIDPPFNTGRVQARTRLHTQRSADGDRTGFAGQRYTTVRVGQQAYSDRFDDFLEFLQPRLQEAHRLLAPNGSLYFHIDYREVHYCKVLLDQIFGRECFLNEIIWAYDYGGRPKTRWPAKQDNRPRLEVPAITPTRLPGKPLQRGRQSPKVPPARADGTCGSLSSGEASIQAGHRQVPRLG